MKIIEVRLWKKETSYKYFDGICAVCSRKYGKGFAFHHLDYDPKELTYRDFKSSYAYNAYIIPIVIKNPKRFMLLCKKHHSAITHMLRYGEENLVNLIVSCLKSMPLKTDNLLSRINQKLQLGKTSKEV